MPAQWQHQLWLYQVLRRDRGGKPAKSNFENYAGKLTETILLSNLAVYAANEKEVPGKKIEWEAKTMTAKNAPEVQHIVEREYSAGYVRLACDENFVIPRNHGSIMIRKLSILFAQLFS